MDYLQKIIIENESSREEIKEIIDARAEEWETTADIDDDGTVSFNWSQDQLDLDFHHNEEEIVESIISDLKSILPDLF